MPASELFLAIRAAAAKARLQAVAVTVEDLHTGWAFAQEETRWFHAASTFKVGILLALLKVVAEGKAYLEDQLHVRNRFHSMVREAPPFRVQSTRDGDPVVYQHLGRSLPLRTLAHAMITRSSNLATNLLLDFLTVRTIRETVRAAGVTELNILRGVEDLAAHEQGIDNETTANGLLQLMRVFAEGSTFLPGELREEGVKILLEQEFNRMVPAKLPARMQAQVRDLVCEHSLIFSRAMLGFDEFTEAERIRCTPVPQRLVRRHPGSGRLSLYLSSHAGGVQGWQTPEALMLLRDLTEFATQRAFVYTHRWAVNDLVVWDNRCTMHRGLTYDDKAYPRDMRRVTLMDSASTLEQAA